MPAMHGGSKLRVHADAHSIGHGHRHVTTRMAHLLVLLRLLLLLLERHLALHYEALHVRIGGGGGHYGDRMVSGVHAGESAPRRGRIQLR